MRKCSLLLPLIACAAIYSAEGNAEKLRAIKQSQIETLEKLVAAAEVRFGRRLSDSSEFFESSKRLLSIRMELAKTPAEGMAIAEKSLADAKAFQASVEKGVQSRLEAHRAQLNVLDMELTLWEAQKKTGAEKLRAHSTAKLKVIEKCLEYSKTAFERGLFSSEQMNSWQEQLFKTKLELANSLEERLEIAKTLVAIQKSNLNLAEARAAAGQVTQFEVTHAELSAQESELALLELKGQPTEEKQRAISKSRLKFLEQNTEVSMISFERGLTNSEDVFKSRKQLFEARIKQGATAEDRSALAYIHATEAKALRKEIIDREKAGQSTQDDVYRAELYVLDAEQALIEAQSKN